MMDSLNHRFAIVDDSPAILLVLEAHLKQQGYQHIETFTDATLAFERISKDLNYYQAVFTDLNMPDMDGMTLIRLLGQQGFTGGVVIISEMEKKVIALASELAKENKTHLIGNISKPIDSAKLNLILSKLNAFLDKKVLDLGQMTERELINAIKKNMITPYYQPKICSKTNLVESVEVLARIANDHSHLMLQPKSFIPTAEKFSLIDSFSFQLFDKAMADYHHLAKSFGSQLKIAVNVSPTQLDNLDFPSQLDSLREHHGLNPAHIIIEITEEYALKTTTQLETLNRLRMRGYLMSLDDFGTGFTNLTQLRTLPFTEIKIDRSLIRNIQSDKFSQVIVESLKQIAKEQHFTLVAEGIEQFSELEYLQNEFDDPILLQGYLICRPKPCNEMVHWYKNWLNHTVN